MEFPADGGFFRQAVVLDLQVVVIPIEDIQIFQHGLLGGFQFAPDQVAGHFPGDAGGQADEPFAVLAEDFLVDPGFIIEAFYFADGYQLHQVLVAGLVFRQEDQVVELVPGFQAFVQVGPGSDVHFTADDGLDAGFFAFLVEFDDSVHDPMVRDGQGRHPQFLGILDQFRDAAGPIQEAVLGMGM